MSTEVRLAVGKPRYWTGWRRVAPERRLVPVPAQAGCAPCPAASADADAMMTAIPAAFTIEFA